MAPLVRIEAENERYAAPLVFLHGLWVGPEIWRRAALGFAHRGWSCRLLDERSGGADGTPAARFEAGFEAHVERVAHELALLEAPAVVIGHDSGALVALALAERAAVRASVAVAPLLEGASSLLDRLTRLRVLLGVGDVAPPPPARFLGALLAPEPASRIKALRGRALAPGEPRVPCALVAQEQDAVVPRSLVEITANGLGADLLRMEGGHWGMLEGEVDAWISPVHRWLIQRLGPSLLLLRGDEDLES
ncbi:MAG: alpha/beta hydrolase [Deltaproteobacteria bacterium]|nr:alpha/beta hydrolase [Deltaproteobacteria bacterium]